MLLTIYSIINSTMNESSSKYHPICVRVTIFQKIAFFQLAEYLLDREPAYPWIFALNESFQALHHCKRIEYFKRFFYFGSCEQLFLYDISKMFILVVSWRLTALHRKNYEDLSPIHLQHTIPRNILKRWGLKNSQKWLILRRQAEHQR